MTISQMRKLRAIGLSLHKFVQEQRNQWTGWSQATSQWMEARGHPDLGNSSFNHL